MPTVSTSFEVDDEGLARALTPRDDTVGEVAIDDRTFACAHGPFDDYERHVVVESLGDGQHRITETTRFHLAIPYWGPMFTGLYKRTLRRRGSSGSSPWWAPPDRLSARAAQVLALLCMLSIFTGYLGALISQTITFAASEFDVGTGGQGDVLSAVRLGAVFTLGIIALADRRGRRIVLIVASVAGCVFASMGALAPDMFILGTTQLFSRACALAVGVLIVIVAAEEMPAGARAYAVSVTTMSGALGAGMVLWMLPIADQGVSAWRVIYLIPLLGLLPIVRVGRVLPETTRFKASAQRAGHSQSVPDSASEPDSAGAPDASGAPEAVAHPVGVEVGGPGAEDWVLIEDDESLLAAGGGVTSARGRFLMLAASAFLGTLLFAPASQFQNEFLRTERDFSAAGITIYSILTNLPGGIGIILGGRLADIYGRRKVGSIALFGGAVFTAVRFLGDGFWLWGGGIAGSLIGAAAIPALGVYGPELFPTDRRGSANGGITLFGVVGSVLALQIVGRLAESWGGLGAPIALMTIGPALLAVLIWVAYPETTRLELEELNPEDRNLLERQ